MVLFFDDRLLLNLSEFVVVLKPKVLSKFD